MVTPNDPTTPATPATPAVTLEALLPLVEAWVPNQRWFGGKGRPATFSVDELAELHHDPDVTIYTVSADYGDGDVETYQVPLVARAEPVDNLEHVLLGSLGTAEQPIWVYDALHDKDVTPAWLTGIRDARSTGAVRFTRYGETDEIPVHEQSLVLSGEQSNTSMIFGDVAIMKVFRRLQPGVNPDIEVQGALSLMGAKHVPKMLGSVEADVDGQASSLAMLQEFMTTGTDGWELAKTSVRDLMAEADLHAEEAGGDFAGEAHRLGVAVAEVHADLVRAFGSEDASAEQLRVRSRSMLDRLHRASKIVPQLAELAPGLEAIFARLGEVEVSIPVHRIHGDLHLGQALRTVSRWVLIDFEGEPMAAMDARREFDSPLRDVAGMFRSFDYAGHHRVIEAGYDPQLAYRADEWAARNRAAFAEGYAEASGVDPRESWGVLAAFEADKAVYEAVYETRNRPTWLAIPFAALTKLAAQGGPE